MKTAESRSKKIVIATGGTGGHVYPAMALAHQLLKESSDLQILFVGGGLARNRYFDRNTFEYQTVACATFVKKSPKALLSAFSNIIKGIWQSYRILRKFKPDLVIGFGSYFAFPPLIAAKMVSSPVIIHEANSIPGRVNRLLAPWASLAAVHFPETLHLLKGNVLEVGMPLRKGFQKGTTTKEKAALHYGLNKDKKILLIFGGSQGARAINGLICDAIKQISNQTELQLLHITGDPFIVTEIEKIYQENGIQSCVKAFEDNMQIAWQAADMVICRAGAGTIAEQLEFEVPGILIPYPYAADNHQDHNADFMVATVGGSIKLIEKGLASERLAASIDQFLKEKGAALHEMRRAMSMYKRKARTKDLCSCVKEYL